MCAIRMYLIMCEVECVVNIWHFGVVFLILFYFIFCSLCICVDFNILFVNTRIFFGIFFFYCIHSSRITKLQSTSVEKEKFTERKMPKFLYEKYKIYLVVSWYAFHHEDIKISLKKTETKKPSTFLLFMYIKPLMRYCQYIYCVCVTACCWIDFSGNPSKRLLWWAQWMNHEQMKKEERENKKKYENR